MVKKFHLNDHCDLIGQNCGLSGLKKKFGQSSRPATCCSLFSARSHRRISFKLIQMLEFVSQLNKWSLRGYNDPKLPKSHFQVTGPLRGLLFLMQNTGTSFRGLDNNVQKANVCQFLLLIFRW